MVPLEIAMAPLGRRASVRTLRASLDVIDKSGVPYQLTPMGTILEGEWADVMGVVTACFETRCRPIARASSCSSRPTIRPVHSRLRSKTARVEEHFGRKLKT